KKGRHILCWGGLVFGLHANHDETPDKFVQSSRYEKFLPSKIFNDSLSAVTISGVASAPLMVAFCMPGFLHCPNLTPIKTPAKATPSSKHLQQASAGSG